MNRLTSISLILLALAAASCVQPELRGKSKEYRDGWRLGVTEAKAEIESKEMTIYTYGLGARSGGVNEETGLPYTAIAGCVVDDFIHGREDGHDQLIYAELGLPWESGTDMVFDDFGNALKGKLR